jgi:hypothetical protein
VVVGRAGVVSVVDVDEEDGVLPFDEEIAFV